MAMMSDEELFKVMKKAYNYNAGGVGYSSGIRAALAAVKPLIAKEAREKALKEARRICRECEGLETAEGAILALLENPDG
jgi:hypothetical protein